MIYLSLILQYHDEEFYFIDYFKFTSWKDIDTWVQEKVTKLNYSVNSGILTTVTITEKEQTLFLHSYTIRNGKIGERMLTEGLDIDINY